MATVLHIDDSHLARTLVRIALGKQGIEVVEAVDGQAGLEAAQTHGVDCILVGLDIPVVDGIELIKRLRQRGTRTPAILVAACPRQSTVARGLKAGASEVIERSELERSVVGVIQRVLRGTGKAAA